MNTCTIVITDLLKREEIQNRQDFDSFTWYQFLTTDELEELRTYVRTISFDHRIRILNYPENGWDLDSKSVTVVWESDNDLHEIVSEVMSHPLMDRSLRELVNNGFAVTEPVYS